MTALRAAGWVVLQVSGAGLPDLLVAKDGRWLALEVKSPGGHLTEAQVETFDVLGAVGVRVPIVTSPAEALAAVGEGLSVSADVPLAAALKKARLTRKKKAHAEEA